MGEKYPRGIRNNNPGNIEKNHIVWKGMAEQQNDKRFVVFIDAVFGLRALMKLLVNYRKKHGLKTVVDIIKRWAPPFENHTEAYARAVSSHLNVLPGQILDIMDRRILIKFAQAITCQENGKSLNEGYEFWYADDLYKQAADMVLGHKKHQYERIRR